MSPTVPAILSAIATAVKAGVNPANPARVETVHTKRRFWRDAEKFATLFRRTVDDHPKRIVNGWMIYRDGARRIEAEERWRFYSIHRIRLDGFLAVADDSAMDQAAFDAQIELIRDGLRLNTSVFGKAERTVPDTAVLEVSTPITVGDVTAWHAVLELEAEAVEIKTLP